MRYPIGITTAKRAVDYLAPLVAAIPRDRYRDIVLAPTMPGDLDVLGGAGVLPAGVIQSDDTQGMLQVMPPLIEDHPNAGTRDQLRCLERNTDRLMMSLCMHGPVFLTLQDDVEACPEAWDRLALCADWLAEHPRVAWISFYTPYSEARYARDAFWVYPASKFYGELAMLWNRTAALEFLGAARNPGTAHDLQIQEYFRGPTQGKAWITLAHAPCLFQHVGVESATGKSWKSGQRTTMNYRDTHHAVRQGRVLKTQPLWK